VANLDLGTVTFGPRMRGPSRMINAVANEVLAGRCVRCEYRSRLALATMRGVNASRRRSPQSVKKGTRPPTEPTPPWGEEVPFTLQMLSAPPISEDEIIERGTRFKPELQGKTLDEIKRALDIPVLAKVVPGIITRALSIIPERQLYEMLRLETFAAVDGAHMRVESARGSARMWKEKAAQWGTAKNQLRAATTAVRAVAESELAQALRRGSGADADATVHTLELYAREAERLEKLMRGLHAGDSKAGERSPKFWKEIVRERAKVLAKRLGEASWSRREIADLILASQTAWDPPPVFMLAPELRESKRGEAEDAHRTRLIERLRDLVDRRSNRRR